MAGLYLHIPFCKQACTYCNFHFSTQMKSKDDLLAALRQEIIEEKEFLSGHTIRTVYFGGGTPSLLSAQEIEQIMELLDQHYELDLEECTLEANPDDLNADYLSALRKTPVDRLSIGVQSFQDRDLRFMNRAHRADQAESAIKTSQDLGFDRLSIDLIYGSPYLSDAEWKANLSKMAAWQIPHFSAYALTVEPKTALDFGIRKNSFPPLSPDKMADQFEILSQQSMAMGYEHYEISNLAKPGHYALHNSRYWNGEPYLGLGPSAHSFKDQMRRWNKPNNAVYIKSMKGRREDRYETEHLSPSDQVNEYLMTSLRTQWGCQLRFITQKMGVATTRQTLLDAQPFIRRGWMHQKEEVLYLTPAGRLFADHIASMLFVKT